MLYLRRALERFRLSVGGVPAQVSHRETPPAHKPLVSTRSPQVPSQHTGQRRFAAFAESATLAARAPGHPAVGTLRDVEDADPGHVLASLPARSSERNGPFVLVHAGGNA
jgi:hypothetical protein